MLKSARKKKNREYWGGSKSIQAQDFGSCSKPKFRKVLRNEVSSVGELATNETALMPQIYKGERRNMSNATKLWTLRHAGGKLLHYSSVKQLVISDANAIEEVCCLNCSLDLQRLRDLTFGLSRVESPAANGESCLAQQSFPS